MAAYTHFTLMVSCKHPKYLPKIILLNGTFTCVPVYTCTDSSCWLLCLVVRMTLPVAWLQTWISCALVPPFIMLTVVLYVKYSWVQQKLYQNVKKIKISIQYTMAYLFGFPYFAMYSEIICKNRSRWVEEAGTVVLKQRYWECLLYNNDVELVRM